MNEELKFLVLSILDWWDLHEFDVTGEYGEYNVYDVNPPFVNNALYLAQKYNIKKENK
mgnify:CR=1 FL=1